MDGITLLADAELAGLNVLAGDGGRLIIRGPRSADVLARQLINHKAEVLALIQAARDEVSQHLVVKPTVAVCQCGATTWRDVPIHDLQSVRRDCGRCGRFIEFALWYGKTALHNEQYSIG